MANVVDFERADDPRDVIHAAVQALAEGWLVGFPTDTVYTIAASALSVPGLAALEKLHATHGGYPYLALKAAGEALDYAPEMSELGRKLLRRSWPGPIILAFDRPGCLADQLPAAARKLTTSSGGLAMRVVPHAILASALKLSPSPLVLLGEGAADWKLAAELDLVAGDQLDLLIRQDPCRYAQSSSVVNITGPEWNMVHEGVVTERTVSRLAGQMFLFVCTGNTCRSPMAEGLFRKMLANHIHCGEEDLMDRGYLVASAGLAAASGAPASPESLELLEKRGIDLREHASQPISPRLLQQADAVYTMTRQHREMILREFPDLAPRVHLLTRDGSDVLDPIGFGFEEYEKCADQIERNLRAILEESFNTGTATNGTTNRTTDNP